MAIRLAHADFFGGLKQIPAEYYEAAAMDGAGTGPKFIHITWPV